MASLFISFVTSEMFVTFRFEVGLKRNPPAISTSMFSEVGCFIFSAPLAANKTTLQ